MIFSTGSTIKTRRVARGWTQAQLADRAGLPVACLNRFERDKRKLTLDAAHKIANALTLDSESYTELVADLVQSSAVGVC
jgi:transcriptional regulator with XRE-family HTH domain